MAIAPYAHGQTTAITFGDQFATVEGTGGGEGNSLGDFSNTAFVVYNEAVITAAGINPGDFLTGLAFRVDGGNLAPNFTANDYRIELGRSINSAGDLVDIFADNADANGLNLVRSGSLDFNAADFEAVSQNNSTGTANAFGPEIGFDTDFEYTGGDLLLQFSHGGLSELNGDPIVESRGDNVATVFGPDNSLVFETDEVQILFGGGFDAPERTFTITNNGLGQGPIVQFTVAAVPEPTSAALLMGLGLIGVARRRRKM